MFQTTNQDLFTMCIYKLTYDLVNVWVDEIGYKLHIPSGKRLHNYGKSPCVIGILTYFNYEWPFSSSQTVSKNQRVNLHFPMVFLWFSHFPMVYQRVHFRLW